MHDEVIDRAGLECAARAAAAEHESPGGIARARVGRARCERQHQRTEPAERHDDAAAEDHRNIRRRGMSPHLGQRPGRVQAQLPQRGSPRSAMVANGMETRVDPLAGDAGNRVPAARLRTSLCADAPARGSTRISIPPSRHRRARDGRNARRRVGWRHLSRSSPPMR